MGEVDLHFKPSVPVFDANVSLGRRNDKRVSVDTVAGTIDAMDMAGIQRALVYSHHAVYYDPGEGNKALFDMIEGQPRLVPQFTANPMDDFDAFTAGVQEYGIRSIRMAPTVSHYPFRDWALKPWLDWMAAERLPLWLPVRYKLHMQATGGKAKDLDPTDIHDTLRAHLDLNAVLCDVHDEDFPWVMLLLRSLSNLYIELSGFVHPDGITMLMDVIGEKRILFGSRFPDASMGPNLYQMHRYGLSQGTLSAICSGNLERLLEMA